MTQKFFLTIILPLSSSASKNFTKIEQNLLQQKKIAWKNIN